MDERGQTARQAALDRAKANSFLSGLEPSAFGVSVFAQWIAGHWDADEAVALLIRHHKDLDAKAASSDHLASPNLLGITDSDRMKQAEADIATLRMADMSFKTN